MGIIVCQMVGAGLTVGKFQNLKLDSSAMGETKERKHLGEPFSWNAFRGWAAVQPACFSALEFSSAPQSHFELCAHKTIGQVAYNFPVPRKGMPLLAGMQMHNLFTRQSMRLSIRS